MDRAAQNSKLILLIGASRSGKTKLLRELGTRLNIQPLNVASNSGGGLAAPPNNKRSFSAGELLRNIASDECPDDPLLLDNVELLFEPGLQVNPLDLLKRGGFARAYRMLEENLEKKGSEMPRMTSSKKRSWRRQTRTRTEHSALMILELLADAPEIAGGKVQPLMIVGMNKPAGEDAADADSGHQSMGSRREHLARACRRILLL